MGNPQGDSLVYHPSKVSWVTAEFIRRPPLWTSRAFVYVLLASLVVLFVYSSIAKVAIHVDARGALATEAGILPVRVPVTVKVAKLNVRDNQNVKAGDVLVQTQDQLSQKDFDRMKQQAQDIGEILKLWRAGTWEEETPRAAPADGWGAAVSPDSRLLARGGLGHVRLVRPDSGAEVARLAFVEQTRLVPICFAAGGAELLVWGEDTQNIHIWDLRLIRAQLGELELDWEDPPLPTDSGQPDVPPAVEFVGADLVEIVHTLKQVVCVKG